MNGTRRTGPAPIVVGIDGSPESAAATRWALNDARSRGCGVDLIHAYETVMATDWMWQLETDVPDLRSAADDLVAEAVMEARAFVADEVDVTGEVVVGHPASVLEAESERAALLVVGSRRLGTARALLGSVSSAVAARSRRPVVVVRGSTTAGAAADVPGARPVRGPVVVGVDGVSDADPILEFAFDFAARHGAPLRAVLCFHPHPLTRAARLSGVSSEELARAEARLAELVAPWARNHSEVTVEHQVTERHPVEALVEQGEVAELLVVGARGRHAIVGTLLGSVSQGVLHHADCVVAVIHAPGDASTRR